jgi:hypothetical protein
MMKLWQKKLLEKGFVQLVYGVVIAIIILFMTNNFIYPLIFKNNRQFLENYQSIIPSQLYPVIILIIICSFLYHYTKLVVSIYKKYNDK